MKRTILSVFALLAVTAALHAQTIVYIGSSSGALHGFGGSDSMNRGVIVILPLLSSDLHIIFFGVDDGEKIQQTFNMLESQSGDPQFLQLNESSIDVIDVSPTAEALAVNGHMGYNFLSGSWQARLQLLGAFSPGEVDLGHDILMHIPMTLAGDGLVAEIENGDPASHAAGTMAVSAALNLAFTRQFNNSEMSPSEVVTYLEDLLFETYGYDFVED